MFTEINSKGFKKLKKSDPARYNKYAMNGVDEETVEIATAHGNLSTANGVQRILVDPDKPSAYANYVEQVMPCGKMMIH